MKYFGHIDNEGERFDKKLDTFFEKKEDGFFIELGANDGLEQSNTAFLEFYRGWTGLLIEPSPEAFAKCILNRPGSICKNVACVSSDYKDSFVTGDFDGGMMSSIGGKRTGKSTRINVNAKPLEQLLQEIHPKEIDFMSLDVEGEELNVLQGMNLQVYRPHYILIEIYKDKYNSIMSFMDEHQYECIENFSNYNKTDNPCWDGLTNDYLFQDTLWKPT